MLFFRKIFVVFVNLCSNYYFADASAENANVMESELRTPRGCDDDTNVLQVRDNPPVCIYLHIFANCNLRKFSIYD